MGCGGLGSWKEATLSAKRRPHPQEEKDVYDLAQEEVVQRHAPRERDQMIDPGAPGIAGGRVIAHPYSKALEGPVHSGANALVHGGLAFLNPRPAPRAPGPNPQKQLLEMFGAGPATLLPSGPGLSETPAKQSSRAFENDLRAIVPSGSPPPPPIPPRSSRRPPPLTLALRHPKPQGSPSPPAPYSPPPAYRLHSSTMPPSFPSTAPADFPSPPPYPPPSLPGGMRAPMALSTSNGQSGGVREVGQNNDLLNDPRSESQGQAEAQDCIPRPLAGTGSLGRPAAGGPGSKAGPSQGQNQEVGNQQLEELDRQRGALTRAARTGPSPKPRESPCADKGLRDECNSNRGSSGSKPSSTSPHQSCFPPKDGGCRSANPICGRPSLPPPTFYSPPSGRGGRSSSETSCSSEENLNPDAEKLENLRRAWENTPRVEENQEPEERPRAFHIERSHCRAALPSSTFHYRPDRELLSPPGADEVVHIADSDRNLYLTVERIDGRLELVSGVLKVIVGELASAKGLTIGEGWGPEYDTMEAMIWAATFTVGNTSFLCALTNHFISASSGSGGEPQEAERILKLIEFWLKKYPDDFSDPGDEGALLEVFDCLVMAADKSTRGFQQSHFEEIVELLCQLRTDARKFDQYLKYYSNYLYGLNDQILMNRITQDIDEPGVLVPLDISSELLAKYLAAAHLMIFQTICDKNTLAQVWDARRYGKHPLHREAGDMRPPKFPCQVPLSRYCQFERREDMIKYWVAIEILRSHLEGRVEVVERFIETATHLKAYGDLYGASAITDGLSAAVVVGLDLTWDCVSGRHRAIFRANQADLSDAGYPRTYSHTPGPVIPKRSAYNNALGCIVEKKDQFLDRNRPNMNSKTHRDISVEEVGVFDTSRYDRSPPKHVRESESLSGDDDDDDEMERYGTQPLTGEIKQLARRVETRGLLPLPEYASEPLNIDVFKWYTIMKQLTHFKDRARGAYEFSRHMTRNVYAARIFVPTKEVVPKLSPHPADATDTGKAALAGLAKNTRGSFNGITDVSKYVETRLLRAWNFRFDVPARYSSDDERRQDTLARLFIATGE